MRSGDVRGAQHAPTVVRRWYECLEMRRLLTVAPTLRRTPPQAHARQGQARALSRSPRAARGAWHAAHDGQRARRRTAGGAVALCLPVGLAERCLRAAQRAAGSDGAVQHEALTYLVKLCQWASVFRADPSQLPVRRKQLDRRAPIVPRQSAASVPRGTAHSVGKVQGSTLSLAEH
jgi:hypothetical protein